MESNKLRCVPFLISIICVVTYGQEWPRLLFHTGETCAIPCLAQSEDKDFFWRKGDHYDASEEIAYNIAGSLYSSSVRYEVLSNGTLMIKNVTAEDEGKYFCRSLSSTSSCYASVTVYVKVTVVPYIDLCSPRSSCTVYSKQDQTFILTCDAKSVSSQTTLKWFNGSKEIVENVKITAGKNSRNETEISSKLTVTFREASFLTCKAADMKLENAFAHVQLVPLKEDEHSGGLIVAISILAVTLCVSLVATFYLILVKLYRQRKAASKPSEDGEKDERVPMLQDQLTKIETNLKEERDKLSGANATVAAKEEALQTIKQKLQEKDQELNELKSDLSNKSGKLKKLHEKLALANKEVELKSQSLKEKEKIATMQREGTDANLASLEKTVEELRSTVAQKDKDIQELTAEVAGKNAELKALRQESGKKTLKVERLEKEVSEKDGKLKEHEKNLAEKDDKLKNIEKEVTEKDANVTKLTDLLNAAQQSLKISKRDHEFSKRELRFKLLATKDVYRHLCLLKMPPGKFNEFAERKSSTVLKMGDSKTSYNYNYIFEENATKSDVYVELEELIQNSVDGGNSCIFVLCSSTNDTESIVFDTENKADEGVIPKAIHRLFRMPPGWKEIGLWSGITVTYAAVDANGKNKNASFEAQKVPMESEDHAFRVLKEYRDGQTVWDNFGNKEMAATNLFQFFIDTRDDKEVYSTGMLMFCTFTDLELIKGCLQGKTDGGTKFTNYVTSAVKSPGTKMAILSVFSEGSKEAAKYQLKFHEFINGEKKKFPQIFRIKKKEENA